MSKEEVVVAVVLAVAAAELSDWLGWLSRRMARRAAHLRYGRTGRAEIRAEEWAEVVKERPGQVLKLGTAFGFLLSGSFAAGRRRWRALRPAVTAGTSRLVRSMRDNRQDVATVLGATAGVGGLANSVIDILRLGGWAYAWVVVAPLSTLALATYLVVRLRGTARRPKRFRPGP